MSRMILAALALAAVAGCARGEKKDAAGAADSLRRDLQLAPVDTTKPLNDQPAPAPVAITPPAPEPAPAPAPKPKPKPKPAPAPRPAPSKTAAAEPTPAPAPKAPASAEVGTVIRTTMVDSIHSRHNKVGDVVTAKTAHDITDADGRVVIPAGSAVTLTIVEIKSSENKSDNTGKLQLKATDVTVDGRKYPIDASVDSVQRTLVGRTTNVGDVAKVGAGVGIGAIVGKVLGGGKGAVIGGVVGGAVGAQRAVETKDRDVYVPPGGVVTLKLRGKFTPS
jgi:hypothetical protein